jgi:SAM-dependent methyltransferase
MNLHDRRWERIHAERAYETYYPFDIVITFVFRYHPRDRERSAVKILEVGAGLGNNLRFIAGAGFDAYGIDVSPTAVERAQKLLAEEGLKADIRQAGAAALPFDESTFDMVLDRGALTCIADPDFALAIDEVRRVLRPGGHFLFTPYADSHSSNGIDNPIVDGLTDHLSSGSVAGRDRALRFVSYNEMRSLFRAGWTWQQLQLVEYTEMLEPARSVDAQWHAILRKS